VYEVPLLRIRLSLKEVPGIDLEIPGSNGQAEEAKQAADKVVYFVIPSEARNLSST